MLGTNDQFGTELESFRALSDLYSSSQTRVPYVGGGRRNVESSEGWGRR